MECNEALTIRRIESEIGVAPERDNIRRRSTGISFLDRMVTDISAFGPQAARLGAWFQYDGTLCNPRDRSPPNPPTGSTRPMVNHIHRALSRVGFRRRLVPINESEPDAFVH